jgi:predicted DNA-binding protein with PD1-like motif
MPRPARIQQPGPALEPRVVAVEGRGRVFSFALQVGLPLLEAVRQGFAAQGFVSGTVQLGALALAPMAYVMPALSKDGKNAAFYSETFRPEGITRLQGGAMTFGARAGAPFFHAHGLWVEANGKRSGGHILPEEAVVAESVTLQAFGIEGSCFEGLPDPETGFTLLGPVPAPPQGANTDTPAFALRLRPNQCLHGALEAFLRERGMARAIIYGGVGSTIGAAFEDGTVIENFATEVFIRQGDIVPDAAGMPAARLDVGLVDFTGQIAQGRLMHGANPVLMTFELIIAQA